MNADFPLLIKTLLTAPLQTVPDQQIISDGLGHFTYRDFACRLHQLAGALSRAGVGQGDVVGVMDWDTHRYLECFFAVPMMGAVLHTINIRLSPAQIAYTIDHAEDDVILVHVDFLPLLEEAMAMVERPVRLFVMRDAPTGPVPISALAIDGIVDAMMAAAPPAAMMVAPMLMRMLVALAMPMVMPTAPTAWVSTRVRTVRRCAAPAPRCRSRSTACETTKVSKWQPHKKRGASTRKRYCL